MDGYKVVLEGVGFTIKEIIDMIKLYNATNVGSNMLVLWEAERYTLFNRIANDLEQEITSKERMTCTITTKNNNKMFMDSNKEHFDIRKYYGSEFGFIIVPYTIGKENRNILQSLIRNHKNMMFVTY